MCLSPLFIKVTIPTDKYWWQSAQYSSQSQSFIHQGYYSNDDEIGMCRMYDIRMSQSFIHQGYYSNDNKVLGYANGFAVIGLSPLFIKVTIPTPPPSNTD